MLNHIGRPDNPALTKYQVLKKFSEFNQANNQLPGNTRFKYTDNAEMLEKNKNLDHKTGLYLSGVVTYRQEDQGRADIFLLDTSDYKDPPDWSAAAGLGLYGIIGSVSFKDAPAVSRRPATSNSLPWRPRNSDFWFSLSQGSPPPYHLCQARTGSFDITNLAWDITENAFSIPTFSKTLNQNSQPAFTRRCKLLAFGQTHVPTIPA